LWLIPRAGHAQEPALSHGVEYTAQLRAFFRSSFSLPPDPRGSFGSSLITRIRGETLEQTVEDSPVRAPVGGAASGDEFQLEALALGPSGYPREELDPLSDLYRRGKYRDAFRLLVRAVNERDFSGLDAALEGYLELPRELPFDFLAAMYCLLVAKAGLGRVRGWPPADHKITARSLARFRVLWEAHPALPGRDVTDSPLAWVDGAK
jgi:hypothetical protein